MLTPTKIQVRFADIDAMGHVNNAVYFSYFETARINYFKQILGDDWDWQIDGVLLVRNEIDYILPISLHDSPEITIEIENIGAKSFTLCYKVFVKNKLMTAAKSVLVSYDNVNGQTKLVPEKMKQKLIKHLLRG
ncbi:MAG: acyl-CoA thioesterase [Bacteroidetes bacterium]|nr:acyl-CoA thioesterase [Bacteroidota bacterium]